MHKFFDSDYFKVTLNPLPATKRTLLQLKRRFDLQVVSSRQHFLDEATKTWLDKHFPETFSGVLFGNHYGTSGEQRSKVDMCRDIGAVAIIDDSLKYARELSEAGIPCVLFGKYAWNGGLAETQEELPKQIVRAYTWNGVQRALRLLNVQGADIPNRPLNISATRRPDFFANLARKTLEKEDIVILTALEKAIVTAVDTAQILVRLYSLDISSVKTSVSSLRLGKRNRIQITLSKTPGYVTYMEQLKISKDTEDA